MIKQKKKSLKKETEEASAGKLSDISPAGGGGGAPGMLVYRFGLYLTVK